jgi:hypothetical protein
MSHASREQKKFRSGSLRRKAKAQAKSNESFEAETERIVKQLKGESWKSNK